MDKTISLLMTILKAKLRGEVKAFYIGDPIMIPESSLPCVSISPDNSTITVADNQRDSRIHKINISLIIDARKYFNATPQAMVGTTFLMETMSKEAADGGVAANSMLGIIRDNLSLSTNRFISNEVVIDYTTRRRTEDLITLEAIMSIEVEHISNR